MHVKIPLKQLQKHPAQPPQILQQALQSPHAHIFLQTTEHLEHIPQNNLSQPPQII